MSAIADSQPRSSPNPFNLRAYLAGGGATTALIAAAVVAFLTIAALVAFNGLPFGGGADSGQAQIADLPSGAPEAAALAVGGAGAPGAVAATPSAGSPVAPAPGGGSPSAGSGGGGAGTAPPDGVTPPPGVAPNPDGSGGTTGVLGGTVSGLEGTAGNLGVNVPLTDLTQDLTGRVDRGVNRTLNNVGGLVGNPNLGNQVNSGVNGLTNKLLP